MKPLAVVRYRLSAQQLVAPEFSSVRTLVRHFGAMQAQDYPGALWEIGLRMRKCAVAADIERAIARKEIVRYWPMRGTIHFTDADDIRWMLALSAERMIRASASWTRKEGLDENVFKKCRVIIRKALAGGKQLTRAELRDALQRGGVSSAGQRGYHIIWRMSYDGLTCFGPHRGKQGTFVLLDEWLPETTVLKRSDALAELALRYFGGHGPATVHDYSWWSGLTVADAKAGIAAIGLAQTDVGGKAYFMRRGAEPAALGRPIAHLLPPFDEFLIAFKDRTASLAPEHALLHQPGGNGVFHGAVSINGVVSAFWRRRIMSARTEIEYRPVRKLSAAERDAVGRAAERYGSFIGKPVVVK